MINRNKNLFYQIIIFISFISIISALYIEFILLIPACKLCLYQRIPYLLSMIFGFFGYFFSKNKIWLYLLIMTFITSLILSGYHLGIENNIFKEFSGCTSENLNLIDKTELLQNLNNFLPNFNLITSIKVFAFGNKSLNFEPNVIKIIKGKAVPRAYPITAPIPPQVAAEAGPNKIQAPSAEATRLVVKDKVPIERFATK